MNKVLKYLDPLTPTDLRVRDLLQRMTPEEKVAQLWSVFPQSILEGNNFSAEKAKDVLARGIGQITRISGALRDIGPGDGARIANDVQRFLRERTRLHIPAIVHEECLSGFLARGATAFPQIIGLASSWDPELVSEVTSVIRRQMRASGGHQGLAPVLDVARDPRWGRVEETYGEDPYLVALMGTTYVKGLQGDDLRKGIIATPKHFVAHGFSEGGRNCAPVHVSSRELSEVFLFPFEAAVKVGKAMSIMNAYHEIDGVPCAASRELLTEILRGRWGFRGFVVSDYWAIKQLESFHHVALGEKEAAVLALEAGLDVELPEFLCYGEPLLMASAAGDIASETLDRAVARVLEAKFLLGLFEDPFVDVESAKQVFDTSQDRGLALKAARESIVVLKNDGVMPLDRNIGRIAVIGPNADNTRNLHGDYSFTAHLACEEDAVPTVSILRGIRSRVSSKTIVSYAVGCDLLNDSRDGFEDAAAAARDSEAIVVVMGERSGFGPKDISGESRDRAEIGLPGSQRMLLDELAEIGKPLVLILVNGRPIALGQMAESCSAIVEAWYPGEEGGNAVADVLFGDYNPGGKLPISFPREVGQIPLNYNRKPSSFGDYVSMSSTPLYPFGHGLSYTRFEYSDLSVEPNKIGTVGHVLIRLRLSNAGEREGDEVVQLYIKDPIASVSRPVKELKGFRRINLKPGATRTLEFKLYAEQLAFYDRYLRLVIEPGFYDVMVGSSSEDLRLRGNFEVVGDTMTINTRSRFFSELEIK